MRANWPLVGLLWRPPERYVWAVFTPVFGAMALLPALRHIALPDNRLSAEQVVRDMVVSLVLTVAVVSLCLGYDWHQVPQDLEPPVEAAAQS